MKSKELLITFGFLICVYIGFSKDTPGTSLGDKVRMLNELTSKRSFIKLNADKFKSLVRSTPRNYSMVVMFTALAPGRGCQICREVLEEYQIVANSWRFSSAYANSELFFASVDFDEGSEVFQMMNLNSAPVIIHFPPKGKRKGEDTFELQRYGFSAEAVSKWAMERTGIAIRIFRPPNYSGTIAMSLLFIIVAGVLFMKRNNLEFIYNSTMWGVICLLAIFAMTSGQMWNHMRGPPFAHRNPQTGQVNYIHGSSQGQFIAESHLVLLLHAIVSAGFIFLINSGSSTTNSTKSICGCSLGAWKGDCSSGNRFLLQFLIPQNFQKDKPETVSTASYSSKHASSSSTISASTTAASTTAANVQDVGKRRVMVIGALVVITVFFSLLLSIFRGKYQGYPYSFLFR
ncbi:dolichyl-diphosphooligosaccharide--protein glycosyltransferase subunit TUSC3-like isoform X1 [Convolutriloba macropyga]|uniref:dolichyl-diphosphooligosaccharide--protein glycosyltransferase subunit TUSC3-like isoform X1 n=1 Tax=Convolutriloba macropyga TaxID=536237 RepID=UPI003F52358B